MAKKENGSVVINGIEYFPKGEKLQKAQSVDGMDYVIIRADRAGVFAGYLKLKEGTEVELINARRLWYWSGAASLSQLAVDGVKNPTDCKFPVELEHIRVLGVIEIIDCSEKARLSIKEVSVWQE